MISSPPASLAPVRPTFRAAVEAFVPEAEGLPAAAWGRLEAAVEEGLRPRPESVLRQIRLFLRAVEWMALVRHGRRFSRLPPETRREFLHALERAPALLVRRGLWGIRTLAFMGYYALPEVREGLGYRAHRAGWEARERP